MIWLPAVMISQPLLRTQPTRVRFGKALHT